MERESHYGERVRVAEAWRASEPAMPGQQEGMASDETRNLRPRNRRDNPRHQVSFATWLMWIIGVRWVESGEFARDPQETGHFGLRGPIAGIYNDTMKMLVSYHGVLVASPRRGAAMAAACAGGLLMLPAPAFGQVFGINLVQNGDAELGAASPDGGGMLVPVPGWSLTDNFTVVTYGAEGWPAVSDPGPADRGINLFVGGRPSALSSASQEVDISSWSAAVDAGGVAYTLSGWLGGWSSQEDNAVFAARFLDGSHLEIGGSSVSIGPVTALERGQLISLLYRDASGGIPNGTRGIEFTLTMTRLEGTDNDGYADNLSFVAHAVPEPSDHALLFGLGLMGAAAFIRHHEHFE